MHVWSGIFFAPGRTSAKWGVPGGILTTRIDRSIRSFTRQDRHVKGGVKVSTGGGGKGDTSRFQPLPDSLGDVALLFRLRLVAPSYERQKSIQRPKPGPWLGIIDQSRASLHFHLVQLPVSHKTQPPCNVLELKCRGLLWTAKNLTPHAALRGPIIAPSFISASNQHS